MVKRFTDIAIAGIGLVLLAPVLALIAMAVRIGLGSPVAFSQPRVGLNGKPFVLTKFRTMRDDVDRQGRRLPDAARLTALGLWLRRWSLDELPELASVLRGDMSLVGPRPLPVEYLNRYTSEQARRHQVRPGLTGLAQVRGRNALSWEEKFALDVYYVDHQSCWLDLKLLLMTCAVVVKGTGISHPGQATMKEFTQPSK